MRIASVTFEPKAPKAVEDTQRTLDSFNQMLQNGILIPTKLVSSGFRPEVIWLLILVRFKKRAYSPGDTADKESCRPDFAIALYPGHMRMEGKGFVLNPNIFPPANW